MVEPISILGFTIKKSPRALDLLPYTITISIAAGVTRIINLPSEFNVLGISATIQNLDAVNVATVIINNDRINAKTITSAHPFSASEINIVQIEITAGAADASEVVIAVVLFSDVGE